MIITKTPLRVSFVGGGTDIYDYYRTGYGAVVSAAINKYMYITVNKRFEDTIRVSYSVTEIVKEMEELKHDLVKECLKMTGVKKGIEITSISDIPSGTGLGSSSCFTVGLLNALFTYAGRQMSSEQLARLACEIEIDILKHPIGKQDQYACACGGINYLQFNEDETVDRTQIVLDEWNLRDMNRKFLMFYTGIRRNADDVLREQKEKTGSELQILNDMRNQAITVRDEFLTNGFSEQIAYELHKGWVRKKTLASKISCSEIDRLYEKALNAGALGGKILGAGGGGFLLVYCNEDKQRAVREALGLKEIEFKISPYGSRVVYFG